MIYSISSSASSAAQARGRSSSQSDLGYRSKERQHSPAEAPAAAEAADTEEKEEEAAKGEDKAAESRQEEKKQPQKAATVSHAKPRGGHRQWKNSSRQDRIQCKWCDRQIVDCPSGWAQHCSAAYCLSRRYYKLGYGTWPWCEWMAQQNEAHERASWDAWLRGQRAPPEPPGPPPRLQSNGRSRSRRTRRREREEEEEPQAIARRASPQAQVVDGGRHVPQTQGTAGHAVTQSRRAKAPKEAGLTGDRTAAEIPVARTRRRKNQGALPASR